MSTGPSRRPPARHVRQERLPQIGAAGQAALASSTVAIVGLGATGSHQAELLARAGVGTLRLVDRDVVELTNLPRQTLFTTADADEVRPKALAAAAALAAIDPGLVLQPHVTDLTAENAERLLSGADLVLDGTDNMPTRFVLNDLCVRDAIPFVYVGVVGTEGQLLLVRPRGPCLRCYIPEPPPPGSLPTCDTAGVLGSTVSLVASLAATEAIRWLVGARADDRGPPLAEVVVVDGWRGEVRRVALPREPRCPCCVEGRHPFLAATDAARPTALCGRDAVQLPAAAGAGAGHVDLAALAERLAGEGEVRLGASMLRLDAGPALGCRRILLFDDGRMIVGDTDDVAAARSIRARLLGD